MGTDDSRLRDRLGALFPNTPFELGADALETIAAHAVLADETESIQAQGVEKLREAGYFGLPIPSEMGGGALGLAGCCAVQRMIAHADPALAIALNMHMFSVGVMVEHWRTNRDSSWLLLEAIATQGRVVASGFAEPGLAGSIVRSFCRADADPNGGYRLSGKKTPCSLAAIADLVCLQVEDCQAEPNERLLVALIPLKAAGITVVPTWKWIGMRGSGSDTILLDECHIPEDLVFHRSQPGTDGHGIFAAGTLWFCLTTAATYIGLMESAIEIAHGLTRDATAASTSSSRSEIGAYRDRVGRLARELLPLTAGLVATAEATERPGLAPAEILPHAMAVKAQVSNLTSRLVGDLAEIAGAGSLSRHRPLERLLRDAQAARFHAPSPVATSQILGAWINDSSIALEVTNS